MAPGPITSWQIDSENVEVETNFLFLGSKIIADGDCSHVIRRQLLSARKWSEVIVAQPCPTLCKHMDYTVHGILQARILEWVAFPFSRKSSQPGDQTQLSRIASGFFTSWATRKK